ncbi:MULTISPECIES: hypothetical protein [unclassified Nocardioides]|jgi:hypothetical protein|uniref:hypothetical protein n=1 Tax=unclassified Nocardioides TaxID=2615069 RepID=UPI000A4BBC98|nr:MULTISPECIES: hypothetical protein [unclassified Nocardioides]
MAGPESGYDLGVDLSRLWWAGKYHIGETVVGHMEAAANNVPSEAGDLYRSGGWGAPDGANGPAAAIESYASKLHTMLVTNARNFREVGEALVLVANDYAATDQAARDELNNRKKQIQQVEGH